MPSTSVIGAIIEFYSSLPVATPSPPTPPVPMLFDEVPARDASGNPYVPPYVLLKDGGTTPSLYFEGDAMETTPFTLEVYALSLAAADAIALGIKYGVGGFKDRLGFDEAPGLPITYQTLTSMLPGKMTRVTDTTRTEGIGYVYKVVMEYTAVCQRTGP